jgi:choline transport protein
VINIGSTIAFNQITSLALSALLASYLVSISSLTLKRIRKEPLLDSHFSLGRAGLPINIASLAFLLLIFVMIFFPPTSNPSLSSMNWSVVIFTGVLAISMVYYFIGGGRHLYVGPVEYVRKSV